MRQVDAIVVGAGLSGLSAAHALHEAGCHIALVEAQNRPGGLIHSWQEHGFLLESGPHTFPHSAREILSVSQTLGLTPQASDPAAKKRYLFLNGRLIALPGKPWEMLTSPVLPLSGKLRALREPFMPATQTADISVADFLNHRVGADVVQNLADPFISGIYAGNIAELSLPAVFPTLWAWEQSAGSLWAGMRASFKKTASPRPKMALLSFAHGLQTLTDALFSALPPACRHLTQRITDITLQDGRYEVQTQSGDCFSAPNLIMATPAFVSGRLLQKIHAPFSERLGAIPYHGLAVTHVGFSRADIPHPLDGFGVLVPRKEQIPLLGAIWASSLFPERAPDHQALLTCFMGGAHQPEVCGWPIEQIEAQVLKDLARIFGTSAPLTPRFSRTQIYPQAIPQYTLGHLKRINEIEQMLNHLPGLHLAGNYLRGVALNECVKSGLKSAERIIRQPSPHAGDQSS